MSSLTDFGHHKAAKGSFEWVAGLHDRHCSVMSCMVLTRRRFCRRHQEIYRIYGGTRRGPTKCEMLLAQRYCQKQIGLAHLASPVFVGSISEAAIIALRAPLRLFAGARPSSVTHKAHGQSVTQIERIKAYRDNDSEAEIMLRFWWAFIAVQYLELSGGFVHQSRHHFLTSVLRLVTRYHGNERP